MNPTATVVMVVHGEPVERVSRALAAVAAQQDVGPLTVCIAAPPDEHPPLARLGPAGAIGELRLIENPGGARSSGLNRAIAAAPDGVVVRVDARSQLPPGYVAACVRRLGDPVVGIVGGRQRPTALTGSGAAAAGIARALRNRWLLGNAPYRRPGAGGPVDTVYLGAFRRDEVLALGGYDEGLDANEDFDLATRYREAGRTVWLEEDLVVQYEPRDDLASLARQYHAFGAAKVRFWRRSGRGPNGRQRVALAGAVVGLAVATWALRRPRRVGALALGALGGVVLVDHLADPSEPDPAVRAHAWVASVVIVVSWVAGVVTGALRGERSVR